MVEMADSLEAEPEDEGAELEVSRPRRISARDWKRFEENLAEIFQTLGLDLHTPGTERTAYRFLKGIYDATVGYEGDPKLITAFPSEARDRRAARMSQVIEGPIPFYALCEHHAFPFFGHAYVGYIAEAHLLGISKLTRIVRLFANRFTLQERMGEEIADLVDGRLQPHGVAVYIQATHLCTQMRGVREHESTTWTTFWRGSYEDDAALRAEFLGVCQGHGH
jgi:GTP cyclohydrolase I